MALNVPVNTPYPSPIVSVPSHLHKAPVEGPLNVPAELLWTSMGGNNKTVAFDLGGNTTNPISKISAITVDNSLSGADVTFIFPDTGMTLPVPAYQSGVFPVHTNSTKFYVSAPTALSVDVTRFVAHNYMPPLSNIPRTNFQNTSAIGAVAMSNGGIVPIVSSAISGTVLGLNVQAQCAGTTAYLANIIIQDSNSKVIAAGSVQGSSPLSISLINLSDMQVRFSGGLTVNTSLTGVPNGNWFVNLLYRTP